MNRLSKTKLAVFVFTKGSLFRTDLIALLLVLYFLLCVVILFCFFLLIVKYGTWNCFAVPDHVLYIMVGCLEFNGSLDNIQSFQVFSQREAERREKLAKQPTRTYYKHKN